MKFIHLIATYIFITYFGLQNKSLNSNTIEEHLWESNKRKDFTPKKNVRTSLYSSQKRTRVQNEEEVNTSDEDSEDDVIFMKEVSGPPLSEFNLAQVKTDGEPDTTEAKKETTPRRRLYCTMRTEKLQQIQQK